MKKRLLIWVLSTLFLPFLALAQTPAEIEAAKAMAKSYGYSESELESLLNSAQSGQTKTELNVADTETHESDGTTVLNQAK